jgi:hypothetical protein
MGVFAGVTVGNDNSIAVLIRLGFVLVAQLDSHDSDHLALARSQ